MLDYVLITICCLKVGRLTPKVFVHDGGRHDLPEV